MIRRVQQIGDKGSFIITLPKTWCEKNDIHQGSELVINDEIRERSVLITLPKNANNIEQLEIEIPFGSLTDQRMIGRSILGRYLDGYDIIKLTEIPDERKLEVRKSIKALILKLYVSRETEIIDKAIEIHVSKEIIPPLTVIDDLFIKAKEMISDAVLAFFDGDFELADNIIQRDEDADKLYFYIVRTLKKIFRDPMMSSEYFRHDEKTNFNLIDALDLRMIASYLENLADSAEELATATLDGIAIEKGKQQKDLSRTFDQLSRLLEGSYKSYQTSDQARSIIILDETKELNILIEKKFDNIPLPVKNTLSELVECIIDIADLVGEQ
ncbi:MAG: hypothetical protein HeimC2_24210 [Candidatus Heimdallarchaeota archaeon LC_2]|nr:MAG: hypothetical protein HeimC2_24210 [Candidatus Heimdallarchaeota archaeon LC_2]